MHANQTQIGKRQTMSFDREVGPGVHMFSAQDHKNDSFPVATESVQLYGH